ncbi:hypothetical protein BOTBODRAFT_39842 [Botryobasidium botryosum FD-172 SS1]|uniref:Malic enzyme n=1 Tax=Botryobasidium botryosum (strain FD-172 SS1) TaxID=930990 RepID=A0A067LUV4_BOTB1|nr:hypothetical protein BOTBODRAFT_39842 [Botryobasidium botryosum FD-172 SS1]
MAHRLKVAASLPTLILMSGRKLFKLPIRGPTLIYSRHHSHLSGRTCNNMTDKKNTTIRVALKGDEILGNPRYNKGSAFTVDERIAFELSGRLPWQVDTLDQQCERAYGQLKDHETDIRRNAFLQSLKAQNWVLYYALISRHLGELIPVIYTPTEAEAISNYSHLFRRSEGLYLSFPLADRMEKDYLLQTAGRQIDLIVVSDSEAILGIGDQGVGGIGISTAKAVIYTLVGGMNPSHTLPVVLDVGTNNQELLDDPLYVGWPEKRRRGEEYDQFVDKFVQLVRKHHPHCLLHFEDFGVTNAQRLLAKYRDAHAIFNDDVQGTGAVTLAALIAAIGVTKAKLRDQRIVVYGAGTAGLGIVRQLSRAMVALDESDESTDTISAEDAKKNFWLLDKHGLLTRALAGEGLVREGIEDFVREEPEWNGDDVKKDDQGRIRLLEVVKRVKPTVLIGTSTQPGAFTEEIVREMSKHVDRPIIFPLSNPSKLHEVTPKDANDWSEGKALIATGSPFPPVKIPNRDREYIIAECNNALIYPGLGLGAVITQSRTLSDTMLIAGTRALAALSPALKDPDDALLPDFQEAREANYEVAVAVAEQAIEEGSANVPWGKDEVKQKVREKMWAASYENLVFDPEGET